MIVEVVDLSENHSMLHREFLHRNMSTVINYNYKRECGY